jgi:hypothetical protein
MADQVPLARACCNCSHVKRTHVVGQYFCRRYPPKVVMVDQAGRITAVIPPVSGDHVCGEHHPEEKTA